jgi:hypothetical protein
MPTHDMIYHLEDRGDNGDHLPPLAARARLSLQSQAFVSSTPCTSTIRPTRNEMNDHDKYGYKSNDTVVRAEAPGPVPTTRVSLPSSSRHRSCSSCITSQNTPVHL